MPSPKRNRPRLQAAPNYRSFIIQAASCNRWNTVFMTRIFFVTRSPRKMLQAVRRQNQDLSYKNPITFVLPVSGNFQSYEMLVIGQIHVWFDKSKCSYIEGILQHFKYTNRFPLVLTWKCQWHFSLWSPKLNYRNMQSIIKQIIRVLTMPKKQSLVLWLRCWRSKVRFTDFFSCEWIATIIKIYLQTCWSQMYRKEEFWHNWNYLLKQLKY